MSSQVSSTLVVPKSFTTVDPGLVIKFKASLDDLEGSLEEIV